MTDAAPLTAVLEYWFAELRPRDWWRKDEGIDADITARFGTTLHAARLGELAGWRESAAGRLTEILVLDQFPRHIHRDTPEAFATDGMALVLAQEAIRTGADRALEPSRKAFMYMPFMHSESALIQRQAVRLFDQPGLEGNLEWARRHQAVIERFGRFPHRNAILGRASTDEEDAFLKQPGSRF